MATIKKACKGALYPKSSNVSKRLGSPSKAKNGKSFPDLNKDGKVTQKDVLIGRGVLPKTAKKGKMVKKAQGGTDIPPMNFDRLKMQKSLDSTKAMNKVKAVKKKTVGKPNYKTGGKMKKCAYGCK